MLKIINKAPYKKFVKDFKLNPSINWQNKIVSKIQKSLEIITVKRIISVKFIQAIKEFVKANQHILKEQKIVLVYWDAHFDNILVRGNKIVGLLDFERTELSSMDFVLDIIKRMVDYPKKYMSGENEKFAHKKDYSQLLLWFREFYSELFQFKNLNQRLDLYAVEHDLATLLYWPKSLEVKQMIAKTINYRLNTP